MTVIDRLAAKAGEVLGNGIPWSTFASAAAEDVYGKVEYYKALAAEMREVMSWADSVNWTWDVVHGPEGAKAMAAWAGVQGGILGKDSVITAALEVGAERLGASDAPQYQVEVLRAFFSQMFSLAMRGYETHHGLLLQHAGVPATHIVNNADMVFFVMRSLNRLHDLGAFKSLEKGEEIGSITPAIAGVIAVGSVAALIVIAWFITKMTTILAQWEVTNAACAAAIANPSDTELAKACRAAQERLNKASQGTPLDKLSTFAGIGILVLAVGYAATLFRKK